MFEAVCKPKVGDDDIPVAVEQEVLEFQVAMNDFLLVDVPDAGDELRKELACILLPQVAMGKDVIKQLASGRIFEDDTDVLVCFDYIVQSDDIGVFENLDGGKRGYDVSGPAYLGLMVKTHS